ncbi:MAG: hypothetical protein WA913_16085 [Pricia sp.]
MFAKLSIAQRIQIGLVLAMAFLLVLGSNRLDQRHFTKIQNTVKSVYDDRVVVQDFIFQLNNIVHQKELRLAKGNGNLLDGRQNDKIATLLKDFKATQLTIKESRLLEDLIGQSEKLRGLESEAVGESSNLSAPSKANLERTLADMGQSLVGLAEVQLNEGELMTELSQKSLGVNIMLSQLEVAFMIVMGVGILFLVFYPSRTGRPIREQINS